MGSNFTPLHEAIIFPAPFVEKTVLSPLNGLGTIVENQLAINRWVYFWTLSSVSLICMTSHMLVLHCLDYCTFVVRVEIRKCEPFVLFQNCFGSSGSLEFPYEF